MTEKRETYTTDEVLALIANVARSRFGEDWRRQTAYGGDRDYYQALGYKDEITAEDYQLRYERQDIAARIVDLPAKDSFKQPPRLSEPDELTETPFVLEFGALDERLKVWKALMRADRLSGIGYFGILLIGFKDGRLLDQEVDTAQISGQKSILYLRAFSEARVKVGDLDRDSQSARFGLPLFYRVTLDDQGSTNVHWQRVIHLAENKLDNEIRGIPRLRPVFNLLDDKMKVIGGTSEATWLNMRPGTLVTPKEGWTASTSSEALNDFLDEVYRYAHDPLRFLRLVGVDAQQIGTSEIADPTGPHDVIIADMAATTGIPQRVLVGSAGGELSAAKEDTRQWASTIASRQKNYCEPEIVRPFIDRLTSLGALPAPGGGLGAYSLGDLQKDGSYAWPSIIEMDENESADVATKLAAAARSLADPAGNLPTTEDENRQILGLPPREPTEQERLDEEMAATVLANRRDGSASDKALLALAAVEALERSGGLEV
jgi:hypothetical protein